MTANLNLGMIGNCQINALIDSRGRYVWSCLPRFDGDPMFCSLLRDDPPGEESGFFEVELDGTVETTQRYLRNTAILETVLTTEDGAKVRLLDFCPRFRQFGRNFRPAMMIRIVERLAGRPVVRVRLRPLARYGEGAPVRRLGSHHVSYDGPEMTLRLTTDASLHALLEERSFVLRDRLTFLLGPDEPVAEAPGPLAGRFFDQTRQYWLDWVRGLAVPFEWQEAVIRAAITLKLCTFEDTGAVIAAATTSIPEAPDSGRNWDYRYCWLRDSFFTVQALNRLGATRTMESYLRYITNITVASDSEVLQPMYGITGEAALVENIVEHLPGYRGMGPVRVGNLAYIQKQHDVHGSVILAATQSFFDARLAQPGDDELFHQLESNGQRCLEIYDQPDAGLWEYRGRTRVHTFPSVMCWAGVERLARIAERLRLADRACHWRERASEMRTRILAEAWDASQGTFTEAWGHPSVDASVLLLAELGFVAADDPRFVSTVELIGKTLARGPYLLRYVAADDFGAPENAFNICTFWYIDALAAIGRQDEARVLFDNMLAQCNPLGLLSEDLDPRTGELWGNFPQTYSLVGLINAAMRLSVPWEEAL